jgi:hypothetical protein
MEAKMYAELYNASNPPKKVDFLDAYVLELKDRPDKPICAVEKYIKGECKLRKFACMSCRLLTICFASDLCNACR